jgi:glycosyltransferase involved in cell wall biosynthesis/SAM-dependent methyltransferase
MIRLVRAQGSDSGEAPGTPARPGATLDRASDGSAATRKMRIFVTVDGDLSKRTGQRTHVIQLCTELSRQGHEVCLFTHTAGGADEPVPFGWVRVRVLPLFHGISYQLSLLLFLLLRALVSRPTVIYARTLEYTFTPALVARLLRVPLILEVNAFVLDEMQANRPNVGMLKLRLASLLEAYRGRTADAIVVVTRGLKELLVRTYKLDERRVVVIPNGADTGLFARTDCKQCKRALRLDDDAHYVCFVGTLHQWQGAEILVRAAAVVAASDGHARFLVVGDGPQRHDLEGLARSLGVSSAVRFTGFVDLPEVAALVGASDICVAPFIPGSYEKIGFSPIKIYEYMASARPVVASHVPGLEFLEQHNAGVLVRPASPEALASGITRLLRDEALRQTMGDNGQRLVRDEFNWAAVAESVASVCHDIAHERGRGRPSYRTPPAGHREGKPMELDLGGVVSRKRDILAVPHLSAGSYGAILPDEAIRALFQRYVLPLKEYLDIEQATMVDCGCGYGWLGLAYVLGGGAIAIMIDLDFERLGACKQIAGIIGVADRLLFICGDITALPLRKQSTEVFSSIQTLEHLRRDGYARQSRIVSAVREMVRVTCSVIVLNTPNALFPVDRHDTGLPFAHWLPQRVRYWYARLFDCTSDRECGNIFISILLLEKELRPFRRASAYKCFQSFEEYWANRWQYSPYGRGLRNAPEANHPTSPSLLDVVVRILGKWYRYLAPTIEGIYVREG